MTPCVTRGFTLTELMVALAAGLIVLSAVVAFMMSTFKSNADYVQSTRLTQELRNTLDLITRDVRRAGYDDNALNFLGNAHTSPFAPILVDNSNPSPTNGSCVLYAYDRTYPNGSATAVGTAGGIDLGNSEVRGMRRVEATVNNRLVGIIEYAESSGTTRPTCADAIADYSQFPPACTGTWCALSDPNKLDIEGFAVVSNIATQVSPAKKINSAYTDTLGIRALVITLRGRLAGNTEYIRDVRTRVKVRADCMRPTTAEPLSTPPTTATYAAVCPGSP